ncbi:MAG: OmpA family protein, partial [Magnetococcales bacterium]|nr:OmpA family protein [Magnetococcales bacterium]
GKVQLVAETDSDHDGVPDSMDSCFGTLPGLSVNPAGCPVDRDGDGVPDYLDACYNTPKGYAVDVTGCPLDADRDKVVNHLDRCPHTPDGVKVDKYGCWTVPVTVLFKPGRSELQPSYFAQLDKVAALLRQKPTRVEIQGHQDNQQNAAYYPGVDRRRAMAVANYLIYRGVSPSALQVVGYGAGRPVGNNATEAGRARNNRVVLMQR